MESAQEIDCRRKSAGDRELSAEGVFSKRDVERRFVIAHTGFPVAARHRDFIKIRRQGGEVMNGKFHQVTCNLGTPDEFATQTASRASHSVPY